MDKQNNRMRILEVTDGHLGYKQYGLQTREQDFRNALRQTLVIAIENHIDVIIMAGDMFESVKPPASCVKELRKYVDEAGKHGIQVLGIEGNHDIADEKNAWLDACGVSPLDSGDCRPLVIENSAGVKISVAGLNYSRPAVMLEQLRELADNARQSGGLDIVVLHCALAEMAGFRGVELSATDIETILNGTGCRLVLLGDIHDSKTLQSGAILFNYGGSLEMTAMDEQDGKTVTQVDIGPDGCDLSVYPLDTRPVLRFHIGSDEDMDRLAAAAALEREMLPLALITYEKGVVNVVKRIKSLVEEKFLYRMVPSESANQLLDLVTQASQQSFERKGALNNLRDVVREDFGFQPESDRYQLIMQFVNTPDQAEKLCEEYVGSKGVRLSTKM